MRILAITLLALIPVSGDKPKPVSVKTIESIQRSVVPIVCAQFNGDKAEVIKVMGTGFLINQQGYFLTAGHILIDWDKVPKKARCDPGIYVPHTPWQSRKPPEIRVFKFIKCQYSQDTDVAACQPVSNPFADSVIKKNVLAAKLTSFSSYVDGTPVAFTGFPLEYFYPITSQGYIAGYLPAERQLVIDKNAWPGASGSPVYDGDGKVIGMIVQGGINLGAGLAYARPADFILEFLSENKIPTEK